MKNLRISKQQVIVIVAILLAVLLITDLNNRANDLIRLNSQRSKIQTEVIDMKMTSIALKTDIAYVTSVAAVEDWAREEGHLVQPGDNLVIPIVDPNFTPAPTVVITPASPTVYNWQVWRELFLGE